MRYHFRLIRNFKEFIDLKIAVSGAMVMGGIVFIINYSATHEFSGSLTAAIKQGTYTFFLGGVLMKSCELLATGIERKRKAMLAAVILPSVFTLLLTFAMHSMKGTPKPFESTLPTLIIIPATSIWAYMCRKKQVRK